MSRSFVGFEPSPLDRYWPFVSPLKSPMRDYLPNYYKEKRMKVITLWQPWAQFIAMGWKTIETRTHNRFAGLVGQEILIHAGLNWDSHAFSEAQPYMHSSWVKFAQDLGVAFFDAEKMGGNILARATVVDSRKLTPEDAPQALIECATPRYGLLLAYIKPLKHPVKAQGKQGIWEYTGKVE